MTTFTPGRETQPGWAPDGAPASPARAHPAAVLALIAAGGRAVLVSYPDVLAATFGGVMLVGVGVSSARAARRRLRYETWYYLHFYTYLAVALAFSHQFAVGAEFISDFGARVVWGSMYAGVAAAIIWYRFITPARQAARHRLRVLSVQPEGPGVAAS